MILTLVFIFWFAAGLDLIWGVLFRIPLLKKSAPVPSCPFPKISVIFAARDEEKHIQEALNSFLALDYPDFEVIAVNDRSCDRTLEIMKACQSPRLKVINIENLPAGWIGKNHALQKAYEASSGQWLLFTDGDVVFEETQILRRVIHFAQEEKRDHIALLPRMVLKGWLEKIFATAFGLGFYFHFRPWAASNPKSKAHIGVGAFNLIRREVYEKLGTHAGFPRNVLDDMELGRRVKSVGGRQTAVFGHELASVPWVEGWQGILRSLEKNGFAGLNYSLIFLSFLTLISLLLNFLPFAAVLFASGSAQALSLGILAVIFLVYAALQRHHQNTLPVFFLHPAGCFLVLFVVCRSAFLAVKNGGVSWRGTFYPLKDLKKN